jgi:hypothetical protein
VAGSLSVDLVAEEEGGGTVVIENQLENSNPDHLGKPITYTAFTDARAAVWIVLEPRPEHVRAISGIYESAPVEFYLLKIEGIRIGDSTPAPLLTLIVGPSEAEPRSARGEVGACRALHYQRVEALGLLWASARAFLDSDRPPGGFPLPSSRLLRPAVQGTSREGVCFPRVEVD